ncbi:Protein of unknown function [Cotesia congregata]|uniref:Uncharacterized protein n=1 Tax=Cotesia congregata TaxID=51543 RepID=A0A8J2HPB3_COTCN|nr:Protein of unknown function [Cotesia congregata]
MLDIPTSGLDFLSFLYSITKFAQFDVKTHLSAREASSIVILASPIVLVRFILSESESRV